MTVMLKDAVNIAVLVFAAGAFIQQMKSAKQRSEEYEKASKERAAEHDKRLTAVEAIASRTAWLLDKTSATLDHVVERLENSPCKEHAAVIEMFKEELRLNRADRERP